MRRSIFGVMLVALASAVACGDSASGPGANANANAGAQASTGGSGSGGTTNSSSAGSKAATGGTSSVGSKAATGGSSAAGSDAGTAGTGGTGGKSGTGGTAGGAGAMPSFDEAKTWIDDYTAAHPGQTGDINAKTPAEIAADPDAQQLLSLCGEDQHPVIPALVWEYGGNDHAWINHEASALVYCIYIPVSPDSENWQYDAGADHVTADMYVLFPKNNPCKDDKGADQVVKCIGDPSNFEILVDTASLNDGAGAGLELSEASTELMLILPDDTKIHLFDGT